MGFQHSPDQFQMEVFIFKVKGPVIVYVSDLNN